jgi:hypothetical protein
MMRVRLIKPCTFKGSTYPAGVVLDVSVHHSLKLIERGVAVTDEVPPVTLDVEEVALPHDEFEFSSEEA